MMYGFWLKAALLLTGCVGWPEAGRVQVGMTQTQAEEIVGGAYSEFFFSGSGLDRCQAFYRRTDCLGGVTSLSVLYLGRETPLRVVDCGCVYWPFHDTPPWLDALRSTVSPAVE